MELFDHDCPRCGRPTYGTLSEGGHRWALCPQCMEQERAQDDVAGDRRRRQLDREQNRQDQ